MSEIGEELQQPGDSTSMGAKGEKRGEHRIEDGKDRGAVAVRESGGRGHLGAGGGSEEGDDYDPWGPAIGVRGRRGGVTVRGRFGWAVGLVRY
jgi:hypothetical protein